MHFADASAVIRLFFVCEDRDDDRILLPTTWIRALLEDNSREKRDLKQNQKQTECLYLAYKTPCGVGISSDAVCAFKALNIKR